MRRTAWIVALSLWVCALSAGPSAAATREYWLRADEIYWHYAPSFPINLMTDEPFTDEQRVFVEPGPDRIGHIYKKAVYRSYTANYGHVLDGPNEVTNPRTGATRILRPAGSDTEHLGMLGPI